MKLLDRIIFSPGYLFKSLCYPNLLLSPNLRGKNTNYEKFVIIAHGRSGSNHFKSQLNSHPEIACFGEIFAKKKPYFSLPNYQSSVILKIIRNLSFVSFIERYIFVGFISQIKYVGFKIFPEHFLFVKRDHLKKWIHEDKSIKIILLHRENLLAYACSLEKALSSQKWLQKEVKNPSGQNLYIDPEKCLRRFERREAKLKEMRKLISHHPTIEITYEQLINNQDDTISKVMEFLGLQHAAMKSDLQKQETRPLSQVITNYQELKDYFSNTKWSKFFKD